MKIKKLSLSVIAVTALFVFNSCEQQSTGGSSDRVIIGETALVEVTELGQSLLARTDTGARTTSINAVDVVIKDASEEEKENIGKSVSFNVINADGESFALESKISGVVHVRNAQGSETRYQVPLTLNWGGVSKTIDVNLRDRSAMTYKLLLGRDWLAEEFYVDVDISED